MENNIRLNYNIFIHKIIPDKNFWVIRNESETFYFVPYGKEEKDILYLNDISLELIKKNIAVHNFVPNNKNKLITVIDNQQYVLMRINFPEEKEFNLKDIINMSDLTIFNEKISLSRHNWAQLWSEKIDYFEYQIKEIGSSKHIVLDSFSYYIGLAENAISYVNYVEKNLKEQVKVNLTRKRIFSPNYAINYLNPLNFIIDLSVRDIAEYLKAAFFNDIEVWDEIDALFINKKFSLYEAHMFYARLLYPSYYFDVYEQIMNNGLDEHELIPIINKCESYEKFLKEMYHYLDNFVSVTPIDWLTKKDPD